MRGKLNSASVDDLMGFASLNPSYDLDSSVQSRLQRVTFTKVIVDAKIPEQRQ